MTQDIDKKIEELEAQARQQIEGEVEPPETEDTPPVEESEEPEVEDSAEQPEVEEQEPEAVQEQEVETCQECERLTKELEIANKRVRDAQSHMHSVTTEASRLRKENESLKTEKAKLEGKLEALNKSDPQEESQIEELYPEMAQELKKRDKQTETFTERLDRIERERQEDALRRTASENEKARIFVREKHPDAADIIPTQEFQTWADNHRYRNHIVGILDSPPTWDTANDVIAIIQEFKDTQTPPVTKDSPVDKAKKVAVPKSQNKARQPEIKPKEGKRYSMAKLKKMPPVEYAKISDDVDKAFIEDRIDP
jgi:hypothetical protein